MLSRGCARSLCMLLCALVILGQRPQQSRERARRGRTGARLEERRVCCVSVAPGMLLARDWTCSSLKPSTREQLTSTLSPYQGACVCPVLPCVRPRGARATHQTTRDRDTCTGGCARGSRAVRSPADDFARSARAPARSRRFRLWMVCTAVDCTRVYASASTDSTYIHRSMRAGSRSYTAHVQKNHGRRHLPEKAVSRLCQWCPARGVPNNSCS